MGVRGLYGFRKGNRDKITYCMEGSSLDRLGKEMVKFIKETPIETMNKIYDKIILVDELQVTTDEQIEECKKFSNTDVNIYALRSFRCLLWKCIGKIKAYRDEGLRYMIDYNSGILNSYISQYAYIINLDTLEFEIYSLMCRKVMEDRYNSNVPDGKIACRLIKTYKLDNIPSNWKKECEQVIYNDMVKLK